MAERPIKSSDYGPYREDLARRMDHQEGRIDILSGALSKLQTEVHAGFARAESTSNAILAKLDSRPTFNFHQSVSTVLQLAVLFSMVVTGIIWVTTGQFGGIVAEQKSLNADLKARLEKHDQTIDKLTEIVRWRAETKRTDDRTR